MLVLSVTSWMLVAHVLLTVQWWEPRTAAIALLGVAFVGACVRRRRPRDEARWSVAHRVRTLGEQLGPFQLIGSFVALALWAASLPSIDTDGFDDWGLVVGGAPDVLPRLRARRSSSRCPPASRPPRTCVASSLGVAPLLIIIYGTLPMLFDTIRYPWAYKHVGVIRLLDETGRLHPDVDIYNNFSGFFGLGAFVRGATGVDPTSYAAWTQLFAQALILAAVWLLVRRATDSERVAHLAVVLYLLTDWVGQNYFAAQTLGTLLSLSVLGLTMSWFFGGETRSLRWFRSSINRIAPRSGPPVEPRRASRPARRRVDRVPRSDDDAPPHPGRDRRRDRAGVGRRLGARHQADRRDRRDRRRLGGTVVQLLRRAGLRPRLRRVADRATPTATSTTATHPTRSSPSAT